MMTDSTTFLYIKKQVEKVESSGFGEVSIKIKNGAVYRVVSSVDSLFDKPHLDKCSK